MYWQNITLWFSVICIASEDSVIKILIESDCLQRVQLVRKSLELNIFSESSKTNCRREGKGHNSLLTLQKYTIIKNIPRKTQEW